MTRLPPPPRADARTPKQGRAPGAPAGRRTRSALSRAARAALVAALALAASAAAAEERFIILASTTSTQDSGLFRHILPLFTAKTGIA
ncbi:MAG: hypothetical protein ACE5LL_08310, partial [Alphaproteobacteria bacterium]